MEVWHKALAIAVKSKDVPFYNHTTFGVFQQSHCPSDQGELDWNLSSSSEPLLNMPEGITAEHHPFIPKAMRIAGLQGLVIVRE